MLRLKENLRKWRKSTGLSMQKLCDDINHPLINLKKYAAYEEGRHEPDLKTLKVIADYYHITLDSLCYE